MEYNNKNTEKVEDFKLTMSVKADDPGILFRDSYNRPHSSRSSYYSDVITTGNLKSKKNLLIGLVAIIVIIVTFVFIK